MSAQTACWNPSWSSAAWPVLLCLFDGDQITASRRRILAAGCSSAWRAPQAVGRPPFAAAVSSRAAGRWPAAGWVAGGAAGFLAASFPFVIGSPAGFTQQVLLPRPSATVAATGGGGLADLTGLPGITRCGHASSRRAVRWRR